MHARKTRQRKKEHMQTLQQRVDELKDEQVRLKQSIHEKNTANILLGMFSTTTKNAVNSIVDPKVDELLTRTSEEIPDATKIPELPALILPGHKSNKKKALSDCYVSLDSSTNRLPNDGIDYELLGKDRSKCTAAELDKIRRERNRMHAKRTRDRKRMFMEEMEEIIKQLQDENHLLQVHLNSLSCRGNLRVNESTSSDQSQYLRHEISPTQSMPSFDSKLREVGDTDDMHYNVSSNLYEPRKNSRVNGGFDKIKSLLALAKATESIKEDGSAYKIPPTDLISTTNNSRFWGDEIYTAVSDDSLYPEKKYRCIQGSEGMVPTSITTSRSNAIVWC